MEYHVGVCNKLFKVSLVMKMTRHYTEQSKDYVCDASCLVNLLAGKDRNEAKEGLKHKVDDIFQDLELQTEHKIKKYYIGKTFININSRLQH